MFTPEHSLLQRSIPLLPPSPPPDPAHHPTLPATRPCPPPDPARHPNLPACLPRQPCLPPQPRWRREWCDALLPSSSSCNGCVWGMQVNVQPPQIFYTPHLIFYVPHLNSTPSKFYLLPPKFYIPHLIFYGPPPIFYVNLTCSAVDTWSAPAPRRGELWSWTPCLVKVWRGT